MKPLTLALILTFLAALIATTGFAADTPAEIALDYSQKTEAALAKIHKVFDAECAAIASSLIRLGANEDAQTLAAQAQAKKAGTPVKTPVSQAIVLFNQYDIAREAALEPVRRALLARIDAELQKSKDLSHVTALGNLRKQIETGTQTAGAAATAPAPAAANTAAAPGQLPTDWTYHKSVESTSSLALIYLHPGGEFEMSTVPETGRWEVNKAGDVVTVTWKNKAPWVIKIAGPLGTIERPDVGTRYMRVKAR